MSAQRIELLLLHCAVVAACGDEVGRAPASAAPLTREELLDPESCAGCHPQHYREWASSMHAYAADDPVFVAMNARGQRDTNGELGSFCVDCHAPMAVREGATADGTNLEDVPRHLKGVTCYFCHNVTGVGEHFNNDLVLADDATLRAGVASPIAPGAHEAEYSRHHDRNAAESSLVCGSCHDIVTPSGVHLERTFAEYRGSVFALSEGFDSCQGCHMDGRRGAIAAVPGAPERIVHEHLWAGLDLALTDFPDREVQRRAVECALATSARIISIVHDGFGGFTVRLETNAGHHQPSGAAQDRRMWIEFIAYDAAGEVVFESGNLGDDEVEEKPPGAPGYDPQLRLFRDWIYDAEGRPTHDFWRAAPSAEYPTGYRSLVLPAAVTPGTPHSIDARYQVRPDVLVARVTVRVRMRPLGVDVVQDLVDSKDLDAAFLSAIPTFTLHGASVEWRPETPDRLRSLWPEDLVCPESYRCLLESDRDGCPEE